MKRCRHCGTDLGRGRPRGLCFRCYDNRNIRKSYPSGVPLAYDHEPTLAELERLIAERMKTMPEAMRLDSCRLPEGPRVGGVLRLRIGRQRGA